MIDQIITYSFYLLFFLTPLFWTSQNFELFEYNKMILTYGITVIIVGAWILKAINDKRLTIKRTPLDIPLLLFLTANILSTIFSIDPHTSIWGYYSRSNGGLLSIISYLLLYWAFVSNITSDQIKPLLKIGLVSGLIISIWGISEHFGVSPSCVILRGQFSANCWVQDVQARVFATLGQPNWLAAYLAMLIFPALYFFLTATTRLTRTTYYLLLTTYYLAFTFTYSRGPTLGLIGGFVVFLSFWLVQNRFWSRRSAPPQNDTAKLFGIIITSFLAINLLFGSALTSFRLVSKFAPPPRPTLTLPTTSATQLETGGTESGKIRLIVWQGALDIFKNYPIFGSGVETFAYSYYQYRPSSHNLTSEWDFLYNKAHNEYLNYLATTGLTGFIIYMGIIFTFVFWSLSRILNFKFSIFNKNFKLEIKNYKNDNSINLLLIALLASYISYLVYNFFLFSVVIIAIFFYLFPALAFVATESTKVFKWPKKLYPIPYTLYSILYRRPIYTKMVKGIVIFSVLFFLYSIFQLWYADTIFNRGQQASEAGNPGRAYNLLTTASQLNQAEPFYRSELAFSAAQAAAALKDTDASLSAKLSDQAISDMDRVLQQSPHNVSYLRTAIRTYFELGSTDKVYIEKALEALDKAIYLAPTDPKLYYNKALILQSMDKHDEAIKAFGKALELKPNYIQVEEQLKETTGSAK
ncbi:O-antigen ligase family protein [Candidatus Daviesbacteria bacterium]|nr:O-antigen ligase family protein [Candidatus Daviesbacteria bacterium]